MFANVQSSQNALSNLQQSGILRTGSGLSELRLFRKWLSTTPAEATAAVSFIRDKILPRILTEENLAKATTAGHNGSKVALAEPCLAKSHWMLASEVSNETFFENKYGFKAAGEGQRGRAVFVPEFRINKVVLARAINSPQLQFARGFKTRRSSESQSLGAGTTKATSGRKVGESGMESASFMAGFEAGKAAERSGGSGADPSSSNSSSSGSDKGDKAGKKEWWGFIGKTMVGTSVVCITLYALSNVMKISGIGGRGVNEISPEDIDVTFADVKGCDEAKAELEEIVDFLMNPDKYSALGGRLPKGCLLSGPPGTGKTLLAKAIAGEANVPFFHASGSEFDEVLVGQGARRVRDLFKNAKARAPCVIFIDEIDTVGGKRTSSSLHPYANQTINQLLSEMDGFASNEGVIVLGATNRVDQLDKALLRPGRFDTKVEVPPPDKKGRKEILHLYLGKIKHDIPSIDVDTLTSLTIGFTGADIENMVNTAALRAATIGNNFVTMDEFRYAFDKIQIGTDNKSRTRDQEDLKITAYHEAGHTLVAYFTKYANPIYKVTIISKGRTGGHMASLPNEKGHQTKAELTAMMDVAMGGRAAEELIFGKDKVTGGASSDLASATNISESMVKALGMSEKVGLRIYNAQEADQLSPQAAEIIDAEVTRMLNASYARALSVLKTHRHVLDQLADALLSYETLDHEDVKAIVEGNSKMVHAKYPLSNNPLLTGNKRPSAQNGPAAGPAAGPGVPQTPGLTNGALAIER